MLISGTLMNKNHTFTVTAARGTEYLLAKELKYLQLKNVSEQKSCVTFHGTMKDAYKLCLWSRIGIRVLHLISSFEAETNEQYYANIKKIDWSNHFDISKTFAIDYKSIESNISHSQFGAQLTKDAIVDQFKEKYDDRPSVSKEQPDIRINSFAQNNKYFISIDLAGESLHRRGYRTGNSSAPLKENLAAALLQRAAWVETAKKGGTFFDPMCGSGTLLIEAAMIAADIAPGLNREYFGFINWKQHDENAWKEAKIEAIERSGRFLDKIPPIIGHDIDPYAISSAKRCIQKAGLTDKISVSVQDFTKLTEPLAENGLFLTNPPYGERIGGDESDISQLYTAIGAQLKKLFQGWNIAVFTGKPEFTEHFGITPSKRFPFYNGPIECRLLQFHIKGSANNKQEITPGKTPGAEMFANRLKKNIKKLKSFLKKEDISCYRIYNADLPEYAAAIDIYNDYAHVQEYMPPKTIDKTKAFSRIQDILAVIPEVMHIPPQNIFLKQRIKQKGANQYEKHSNERSMHQVSENGLQFLVNYTDYLDTGLFIDHRITRNMIRERAKGVDFLNLFAYTGSATVYAAAGGAKSTTTVDMSNTYLEWAEKNLRANNLAGTKNRFIRADCIEWLKKEKKRYGLIFLDPPTFSNSKKMDDTFDIQRDHVEMIKDTAKLLDKNGTLFFSCNNKSFKLDIDALEGLIIKDITKSTIPKDFERTPKFHFCWEITHNQ